MKAEKFAELIGVSYDKDTDRVFLKFEVFDSKYKDFALRIAGRDDIEVNFVGESLEVEVPDEPEPESDL